LAADARTPVFPDGIALVRWMRRTERRKLPGTTSTHIRELLRRCSSAEIEVRASFDDIGSELEALGDIDKD
jgi:hypothetical protein